MLISCVAFSLVLTSYSEVDYFIYRFCFTIPLYEFLSMIFDLLNFPGDSIRSEKYYNITVLVIYSSNSTNTFD